MKKTEVLKKMVFSVYRRSFILNRKQYFIWLGLRRVVTDCYVMSENN